MSKLHTTLEPGDVVLIPSGSGASIEFIAKSGKRSRVAISSNQPVTITRASNHPAPAPAGASRAPLARRPVPTTG